MQLHCSFISFNLFLYKCAVLDNLEQIFFLVMAFIANKACIISFNFSLNMGQTRPLFVYFRPFLNTMTNIVQHLTINSVDGVLGIQTQDCWMVGADKSRRTLIDRISS